MRYINPKTDFGFKKIFGSEESKEILISFLNAIIYENQEIIDDLEIIDPYQAPEIKGRKYTYLDVKARLKDGTKVIIEMQLLNAEFFEKRILYNTAKAYALQLSKGQEYPQLTPVIAVTITDFILFKEFPAYRSCFVLKETTYLTDYLEKDFKLIFVELTKFEKPIEELESLAEKWIYFLKSANKIESIPDNIKTISSLERAFEIAERSNLTELELDEVIKEEMFIEEQKGAITLAKKEGIEEGKQEGRQEGKIELIMMLLNQKHGIIPSKITSKIQQVSPAKINQLITELLTIENLNQLQSWLENY
jgi:predicted transposase/invertase (TIGR01784 family)